MIEAVCPAWTPRHRLFSLSLCVSLPLSLSLGSASLREFQFPCVYIDSGAGVCVPRSGWGAGEKWTDFL